MTEADSADFDRLCQGELRDALASVEAIRAGALKRFWLFVGLAAIIGVGAYLVGNAAFGVPGAVAAWVTVAVVGLLASLQPLNAASRAIKSPIATAVARQRGFTWVEEAGAPDGLTEAERILFGGVSSRRYGDLFRGPVDGREVAIGEVTLTRQSGKSSTTVFQGHVWRLQAGQSYAGVSVAVPDKGVFNFMAPSGLSRVKMSEDPAFDQVYEVYGSDPDLTRAFFGPDLRAELVAIRADAGRCWVYLGGDHVLVAVWGPDRFEPGSMFKRTEGVERARGIWKDLNGAIGFAWRLSVVFPTR